MKTKNLLQTIILVVALCVMNQFVNAQSCNSNQTWACRCFHHQWQCKCVNTNSLSHWQSQGGGNCFPYKQGETNISNQFLLDLNPNPVSTSATISFSLEQKEKVCLKIFDMNGRLVSTLADKIFDEGENEIVWNAEEVKAGIYFLQFQSEGNLQTEKLIVTK